MQAVTLFLISFYVCVCHFCVTAENSLLRFTSEDKTPGENFLLGRSLSQNRRKAERGGSPTHYTLVPALQMDVSLSTSTSDSASLYHASSLFHSICSRSSTVCRCMSSFCSVLLCRCLSDPHCGQGRRRRVKVGWLVEGAMHSHSLTRAGILQKSVF